MCIQSIKNFGKTNVKKGKIGNARGVASWSLQEGFSLNNPIHLHLYRVTKATENHYLSSGLKKDNFLSEVSFVSQVVIKWHFAFDKQKTSFESNCEKLTCIFLTPTS